MHASVGLDMRGLNLYLFHKSDNQILDKICKVILFDFGRFTVTSGLTRLQTNWY